MANNIFRDDKGKFISSSQYLKKMFKEATSEYDKKVKEENRALNDLRIREAERALQAPVSGSLSSTHSQYTPHNYTPVVMKKKRFKFNSPSFDRTLAIMAIITSGFVAYLNSWQFVTLVTRFEVLKWMIFHPHGHFQ